MENGIVVLGSIYFLLDVTLSTKSPFVEVSLSSGTIENIDETFMIPEVTLLTPNGERIVPFTTLIESEINAMRKLNELKENISNSFNKEIKQRGYKISEVKRNLLK